MRTGARHWWYIHKNGHLYSKNELTNPKTLNFDEFEILPDEYFSFNHPYNKIVGGGTLTNSRQLRKILFHCIRLNRLI
jgi:hypothetical protein